MSFNKGPVPVSPLPHYPTAGGSGTAATESPPPSPGTTHATTTTTCSSGSPGGDYNYGNTSPQSPYSVASSNISPHYYADSPYSVQTYTSQASSAANTESSSTSSAYAGDNETTTSKSAPTAKKAKTDEELDAHFEHCSPTLPTNAFALAMLEQSLSEGPRPNKLMEKKRDLKKERAANLRALNLMDSVAGGERQRTLSNDGRKEMDNLKSENDVTRQRVAKWRALNLFDSAVKEKCKQEEQKQVAMNVDIDGRKESDCVKSENYVSRQRDAKWRALNLLHNTVKDQQKHDAMSIDNDDDEEVPSDEVEDLNKLKTEVDVYRQRGAKSRALNLLDHTVSGEKYKPPTGVAGVDKKLVASGGGLTARQAANTEYEKRKREKTEVKNKLRQDKEKFGRIPPKITVPTRQEALAESTRRHRQKTAGDVRDPETVAGMKCQLDWEREKFAQAKALRLLNLGFQSIS